MKHYSCFYTLYCVIVYAFLFIFLFIYAIIPIVMTYTNKLYIVTIIFISSLITFSCTQVQKNKMELDKAYDLSVDAQSEKELLEALKIYDSIINQKIYAQERMGVVYRLLGDRSLANEQYGYAAKYFTEAFKDNTK